MRRRLWFTLPLHLSYPGDNLRNVSSENKKIRRGLSERIYDDCQVFWNKPSVSEPKIIEYFYLFVDADIYGCYAISRI